MISLSLGACTGSYIRHEALMVAVMGWVDSSPTAFVLICLCLAISLALLLGVRSWSRQGA